MKIVAGQADAGVQPPATVPSVEGPARRENEFRISDVPPRSALLVGDVAVFDVEDGPYPLAR